jgi:hypothetical protein
MAEPPTPHPKGGNARWRYRHPSEILSQRSNGGLHRVPRAYAVSLRVLRCASSISRRDLWLNFRDLRMLSSEARRIKHVAWKMSPSMSNASSPGSTARLQWTHFAEYAMAGTVRPQLIHLSRRWKLALVRSSSATRRISPRLMEHANARQASHRASPAASMSRRRTVSAGVIGERSGVGEEETSMRFPPCEVWRRACCYSRRQDAPVASTRRSATLTRIVYTYGEAHQI